jgi:ADP-L-glycero-D-manno-heptose 6-epimerase
MIVITGGAGFIGSVLAAELEARGLGPLMISDWLGTGEKWKNIAKRTLHEIVPPPQLAATLEAYAGQITGVFHMGAISETSWTDGDAIVENNVRLSIDLWNWCAKHSVPFIYASSAATYGGGEAGFKDDNDPAALAALRPLNLYGWSKQVVDRRFIDVARTGGPAPPRWAGFKFFNVFGPNEYHKGPMRSVVVQVFEGMLQGKPASLFKSSNPNYADGGQMRDFVWVHDVVDAMIWFYQHGRDGGIYNLGSGKARSFADLATAVFEAAGRKPEIRYIDMPESLKDRYQYFTEGDMGRLRAAGWPRNSTSLEQGVEEYVRHYLSKSDRYA